MMEIGLGRLADRIVEDNPAMHGVEKVHVSDDHSATYVDFVAPHGVDWDRTDDMGGWMPAAAMALDGSDSADYRVWFTPEQ